ncbi:hypothetical protein [Streptomyces sp. NPDC051001]|uniref:hypothetical protein n=1 Tax=Streptomyces sp. NPDC051001 TaxID=3155795 RepID=UPI00342A962A
MGIDLELHNGRPHRPERRRKPERRKPTLIRQSYEHGEALAGLISELSPNTSGKLWMVDPYNDTLFNEQVAEAALREIPDLLSRCSDDAQTAAVRDLAAFLEACATTPGSYLVFVGD